MVVTKARINEFREFMKKLCGKLSNEDFDFHDDFQAIYTLHAYVPNTNSLHN